MPAFRSVLLGFVVSAWVTLAHGADTHGYVLNTTERQIMLAVCAVAASAGLAIGAATIRSLQSFGFLGLLAVFPVAVCLPRSCQNTRVLFRVAVLTTSLF
ncbi:MAG: hypothetical protein ACYDC9_02470 [Dermatophilaceae bacterium]